ncbi:MAG: hypothetical protein FD155_3431 [Bacteroidetes bacterium]|nr:MAG: hypothetical protein FD155_3431 [Bacteroidota bacterium]
MSISIREVKNKKDLKTFIYLPEKIHKDQPGWVHPLYGDDFHFFDRDKNKSFQSSEVVLLLAWEGSKAVGRIMGIINTRYNELRGEKNARFCFLECYNDFNIAQTLIQSVESWALTKEMTQLIGPLGFSDKEPQGMLIEGFQEQVVLATNYNFPWLPQFLEQLGFTKEVDLVSYLMPVGNHQPERLEKIYSRALQQENFSLLDFTTRKSLKPWVVPIFQLINDAYKNIYGFIPLEESEMHAYAKRYLPILDPRFVKVIVDNNHQVVAFIISMPEISKGIRKAKGRLWPFGWIHILRASKETKLLTLLLGGVASQHRGKGLDAILSKTIFDAARKAGLEQVDSHLILEQNRLMRAECERHNGKLHKRYRVFSKELRGV